MVRRRHATEADKPFIKSLNKFSYEGLVKQQFGEWDDDEQDRRFEEKWKDHAYEILEIDGVPSGVLWVSQELDHRWLREIQIVPARRNQGVGAQVLKELIDEARELDLPLRLRVLKLNRARVLYERLGFEIVGECQESHFWMQCTGSIDVQ